MKLFIRDSTGGTWRHEQEWPIARTAWTRFHLDAGAGSLSTSEPDTTGEHTYAGLTGGTVFLSEPLTEAVEITGPSKLALWVSASAADMDVFVTLDNILPDGSAATFEDASGMAGPVTKGWLRASHRALDEAASTDYRPVHTHVDPQPLAAGEPVLLDIEVMPTSMVFEVGHRIRVSVRAGDDGEPTRFRHDDPVDRDPSRFAGDNTLHSGPGHQSYWLAPVIPTRTGPLHA